jgi:hypothetical protein
MERQWFQARYGLITSVPACQAPILTIIRIGECKAPVEARAVGTGAN